MFVSLLLTVTVCIEDLPFPKHMVKYCLIFFSSGHCGVQSELLC